MAIAPLKDRIAAVRKKAAESRAAGAPLSARAQTAMDANRAQRMAGRAAAQTARTAASAQRQASARSAFDKNRAEYRTQTRAAARSRLKAGR